jgi:hypothetical protein
MIQAIFVLITFNWHPFLPINIIDNKYKIEIKHNKNKIEIKHNKNKIEIKHKQ